MREGGKSISGVAALVLLAVFAGGILSVLLTGTGVYQHLAEQNAASYDRYTCVQYLANKVRQAPSAEALVSEEAGGLVLREWAGGEEYWTRIYCHDGWIMELFSKAGTPFAPGDGERILPAQSLWACAGGGLLEIRVVDGQGFENTLLLALRGGEKL